MNEFIQKYITGYDGGPPGWFIRLTPAAKRLRQLVKLYGITDAQQRALDDLVLNPSEENLRLMKHWFSLFVEHGALPLLDDEAHHIKYKPHEIPIKPKTAHLGIPGETERK